MSCTDGAARNVGTNSQRTWQPTRGGTWKRDIVLVGRMGNMPAGPRGLAGEVVWDADYVSWAVATHSLKGQGRGGNRLEGWRPGVRQRLSSVMLSTGPRPEGSAQGAGWPVCPAVSLYSWLRRTKAPLGRARTSPCWARLAAAAVGYPAGQQVAAQLHGTLSLLADTHSALGLPSCPPCFCQHHAHLSVPHVTVTHQGTPFTTWKCGRRQCPGPVRACRAGASPGSGTSVRSRCCPVGCRCCSSSSQGHGSRGQGKWWWRPSHHPQPTTHSISAFHVQHC